VKGEFGMALYRLGLISADIESEPKGLDYLDKARHVFVALGAEHQDDLARCYHHLGRLHRLTNQLPRSQQEYRKALDLWSKDNQAELARSQLGLGNVLAVAGQFADARAEYGKALTAWQKLAAADGARPEYQRDIAMTHNNRAMVLKELGNRPAAIADLGVAAKIQRKLVEDYPGASKYQDDLARNQFNRGDLFYQADDFRQGRTAYAEAADLWDKLIKSQPAVIVYQILLADARAGQAKVYSGQKDFARAIDLGRQALSLRRKLADKHPEQAKYQDDLARGHVQLGDIFRQAGQSEPADREYQDALSIQKKLPAIESYQANEARTHYNLGLLRQADKRWPEAEEALARAFELWDKLYRRKATPEFAAGLVTACWQRAEVRGAQMEFTAALGDWDRAVEVATPAQRIWFRRYRARALAQAGQLDRAVAEADELTPAAASSGEALYVLASVYALAAGGKDVMADRAMALLTNARRIGFFENEGNRRRLADDPEWRALRSRPDFRELQNTVKQ
jgi:tetratricopeptide (TPR) repeat protein